MLTKLKIIGWTFVWAIIALVVIGILLLLPLIITALSVIGFAVIIVGVTYMLVKECYADKAP